MKTKNYKFGDFSFKAYYKKVGNNFEICVNHGTKQIFFGNFIYSWEANQWWTEMNRDIANFKRNFWVAKNVSKTWYTNFFTQFLYNHYYKFLERSFTKYNRTYEKTFNQNLRKYQSLKKYWDHDDKTTFYRKSA